MAVLAPSFRAAYERSLRGRTMNYCSTFAAGFEDQRQFQVTRQTRRRRYLAAALAVPGETVNLFSSLPPPASWAHLGALRVPAGRFLWLAAFR